MEQAEIIMLISAIISALLLLGTVVVLSSRVRACLPVGAGRRRAFPPEDDIELQEFPCRDEESFQQIGELHIPPGRMPTLMAIDIVNRCAMMIGYPTNGNWNSAPPSNEHGCTDSVDAATTPDDDSGDLASTQQRASLETINLGSPAMAHPDLSLPAMTSAELRLIYSFKKARDYFLQRPRIEEGQESGDDGNGHPRVQSKTRSPKNVSPEGIAADKILVGVFVIGDGEDELDEEEEQTATVAEVAFDPDGGYFGSGRFMAALYPEYK